MKMITHVLIQLSDRICVITAQSISNNKIQIFSLFARYVLHLTRYYENRFRELFLYGYLSEHIYLYIKTKVAQ